MYWSLRLLLKCERFSDIVCVLGLALPLHQRRAKGCGAVSLTGSRRNLATSALPLGAPKAEALPQISSQGTGGRFCDVGEQMKMMVFCCTSVAFVSVVTQLDLNTGSPQGIFTDRVCRSVRARNA